MLAALWGLTRGSDDGQWPEPVDSLKPELPECKGLWSSGPSSTGSLFFPESGETEPSERMGETKLRILGLPSGPGHRFTTLAKLPQLLLAAESTITM